MTQSSFSTRSVILAAVILLLSTNAWPQFAGGNNWNWLQCKAPLDVPPRPVVDQKLSPGESYITADHANMIENGPTHLEGKVEMSKDGQQIRADVVDYNQATDIADLHGDVNYWDDKIYMHSDTAHLERKKDEGTFSNVRYRILSNRGRGKARKLYMVTGKLTVARSAEFTSCDPGKFWDLDNDVWKLYASKLTLNHETHRGRAINVILKVKNIPVFYTPFLTFPLNKDRKSGFLAPSFGSSKRNGVELQVPYYWNIAPNMDATITPRLITNSGLMLTGEYRYLFHGGGGQINAEYLPSDRQYDHKNRSLISLKHHQIFARRGTLDLLFNNVSDRDYLEDFGGSQSVTSTSYLERRADVKYSGKGWNIFGRVQDFQLADKSVTATPYRRLPQIFLNAYSPAKNRAFRYELKSEVTYFDNDNGKIVKGLRFDATPSITYPISAQAYFFRPKLGLRYTMYDLRDSPNNAPDTPDRLVPFLSLDTGVYLERDLSLFKRHFVQTLEPRLYYLYVPRANQSGLPVFDTGLYDFNYYSMFYENRFSGADRFGDANQATLAVTSRLINAKGRQLGQLSVGQIVYLQNRKVTLPGQAVQNKTISPLAANFNLNLQHGISLSGELQWDPNNGSTRKLALKAQYRPSSQKVINLAYRVRRTDTGAVINNLIDIEQTDVSFHWPVKGTLSLVGRWAYALQEGKTLDMFGGLEYDSCCWSLRLVGRRFLSGFDTGRGSINDKYQTGVFIQVELKGLAGMGRKTVDFLSHNIPGYTSEF